MANHCRLSASFRRRLRRHCTGEWQLDACVRLGRGSNADGVAEAYVEVGLAMILDEQDIYARL